MNKLDTMSGELFRIIADAANSRGGARSKGASAGGSTETSPFRQLLRTLSQQSSASTEQGSLERAKPSMLRFHKSDPTAGDDRADETSGGERPADQPDPMAGSQPRPDHPLQSDAQHRPPHFSFTGAEIAAAPIVATEAKALSGSPANAAGHDRQSAAPSAAGESEHAGRPQVDESRGAPMRHGVLAAPQSIFEDISADIEASVKLSSRDVSPPAIAKVSVIQQETHFPPVPQMTVAQSIADAVVAELKGSSSAAPVATGFDLSSSPTNGPDQPLKILTIRLDPPSLGTVTVRFRLTGDAVSIHLAADRGDTTKMLEEQRDSIRELMRSAGYAADVASVQHGSLDGLQSGSGQQQASFGDRSHQAPQSQSQGSADSFNQSSGDAQNRAWRPRQEREQDREVRREQDVVSSNRSGAVYL